MNSLKAAGLLAALLAFAGPAQANGVSTSIDSGETRTGNLSGEGVDTYTFTAAEGGAIVAAVGETGTHDENFIIGIERIMPDGRARGKWKTYSAQLEDRAAAQGT